MKYYWQHRRKVWWQAFDWGRCIRVHCHGCDGPCRKCCMKWPTMNEWMWVQLLVGSRLDVWFLFILFYFILGSLLVIEREDIATSKGHFTHETESPSWPLHLKHSHWWKRRSQWSKFATSRYARGTNGVYKWMQEGCKVYMDSYVASNGSCFMVTWIVFKNYLLEVSLTQNRENMALRTLTTVDSFILTLTTCMNRDSLK